MTFIIGVIFHGFFEVEPDVPKMVEINVASKNEGQVVSKNKAVYQFVFLSFHTIK